MDYLSIQPFLTVILVAIVAPMLYSCHGPCTLESSLCEPKTLMHPQPWIDIYLMATFVFAAIMFIKRDEYLRVSLVRLVFGLIWSVLGAIILFSIKKSACLESFLVLRLTLGVLIYEWIHTVAQLVTYYLCWKYNVGSNANVPMVNMYDVLN